MLTHFTIHSDNLDYYAQKIAHSIQPGIPVLLSGPLGVGKSTFARAILKILIPNLIHIPSPSFPIMIPYDSAYGKIWHMDLYRIENCMDIAALGLEEILLSDRCLIEWPDRLGNFMPSAYTEISLAFLDPTSEFTTSTHSVLEDRDAQRIIRIVSVGRKALEKI